MVVTSGEEADSVAALLHGTGVRAVVLRLSEVEAAKEEREVEEPEEVVVVEGARARRDSRDHAGETR